MDGWIGAPRVGAKAIGQRPRALPLIGALTAALACFLPDVALSDNAPSAPARMPFGLYAHVDIEDVLPGLVAKYSHIQIGQSTTQACAVVTASSPSDLAVLHAALQTFYTTLLSNNAISGITAGVHWCRVQIEKPNSPCAVGPTPCYPDGNDWSYVDDIFTAVRNYNTTNKANKTIQLIVTPGVYSPSWLTDGSILKSCNQLFTGNQPFAGQQSSLSDCGMVTFNPYPEQRNALSTGQPLILPMPLPWSSEYLHYWRGFVEDLAAKYGPDPALVAVVIAGPTAATTEMILPTTANNSLQCSPLAGNPTLCSETLAADQAWQMLITNSFPNNRDYKTHPAQIFVDYWERAIRMYEQIFSDSNLALIITPDDFRNMPDFAGTSLPSPPPSEERKQDFANFYTDDCSAGQAFPISCQTKATVTFYFLNHSISPSPKGKITRGTSVGGMTARSSPSTGQIDVAGVKLVTANPSPFTANGVPLPGGPFIGGAEFDHELTKFNLTNNTYQPFTNAFAPVSANFQDEACLSAQTNCVCPTPPNCAGYVSVEQGAFQVFTAFFYGTKAAYLFNGAATTPPINFQAPVQWVDLEWEDVMYALSTAGKCALASTTTSTQFPGKTLLQDVFNQANYGLQVIAGLPNISPPALICGP